MSTSCINLALSILEESCGPRRNIASLSFVDNSEVATRLQHWNKKGSNVSCEISREGEDQKNPPPRPPKPPTPRPSTPTPPPLQTTHSAYLEKERDRCYRLHVCNESSCRVRICASGSSWDTFQNAMQKRRFASATNSPKMDLRNLRLFSFFIWAHVYASKVFKWCLGRESQYRMSLVIEICKISI